MNQQETQIGFDESISILGIEKYRDRILNSNSNGEIIHLLDYIHLAQTIGKNDWFSDWFESVVKFAEEKWSRPESIFQHIPQILKQSVS